MVLLYLAVHAEFVFFFCFVCFRFLVLLAISFLFLPLLRLPFCVPCVWPWPSVIPDFAPSCSLFYVFWFVVGSLLSFVWFCPFSVHRCVCSNLFLSLVLICPWQRLCSCLFLGLTVPVCPDFEFCSLLSFPFRSWVVRVAIVPHFFLQIGIHFLVGRRWSGRFLVFNRWFPAVGRFLRVVAFA